MMKEMADGRYYVSVHCSDGVRRWRVVRAPEPAKLLEPMMENGWFNGDTPKSGKQRNRPRQTWTMSHVMSGVIAKWVKVFRSWYKSWSQKGAGKVGAF